MSDRTYYLVSASTIAASVTVASVAWTSREVGRVIVGPDEANKVLGRLVTGQEVEVPFRIHNGSSRPLQIVGATMTCDFQGCLGTMLSFPMTVPAGEDVILTTIYKTSNPGIFSHPMTVFTDSEQAPKIALRVSGEIVDPKDSGGS
jgi:hypothetical protein